MIMWHMYVDKINIYMGWNKHPEHLRINEFLMNLGFTKSKVDSNLYYKVENDGIMILLLYVDDIFLIGKENLIGECKKNIAT